MRFTDLPMPAPDDTLFSVFVKSKTAGVLSEVLDFTFDSTPKAAYDSSQVKRNVILEFDERDH